MRRKMSGLIAIRRIRQIVMVVLTLFLAGNFTYADAQSKPEVRLVLQITIDGLRADLINRYENGFSKGGFRLLMKKGAYFTNAHYQHANTETIVGHTTLATGTFPSQHGMVGNVWFDREAGELAYNIEDPDHPLIPTREDESQGEQVDPAQKKSRTQGRSPAAILVPTFGDGLAAYYGGRSKIFGVSGKDRSAVAMAGHVGKAFWYSANTGDFVTSTYYYDAYPDWAAQWNARRQAAGYAGKSWALLNDAATYLLAAQDDRPYEVDLRGYGRIFPHPFGQADDKLFFTRILVSPIGDQLTLDFSKTLITHEQLGQDEIPDYLSISFSAVDAVNHFFGPSSLENEDVVVQLDRTLADLFAFIDKTVGLKHTLIVLSADHGMADMPEYMTELGYKAGRLDPEQIAAAANKVGQKFGVDEIVRFFYRPYLYLNDEKIAAAKLDRYEGGACHCRRVDGFRWDCAGGRDQQAFSLSKPTLCWRRSGTTTTFPAPAISTSSRSPIGSFSTRDRSRLCTAHRGAMTLMYRLFLWVQAYCQKRFIAEFIPWMSRRHSPRFWE